MIQWLAETAGSFVFSRVCKMLLNAKSPRAFQADMKPKQRNMG